jgi:hypothetical protein
MFQWIVSAAAWLTAAVALGKARRASKRLERLTESYWELRYEHGQLRSRVARLEPVSEAEAPDGERRPAERGQGATHFVPLSSLKR